MTDREKIIKVACEAGASVGQWGDAAFSYANLEAFYHAAQAEAFEQADKACEALRCEDGDGQHNQWYVGIDSCREEIKQAVKHISHNELSVFSIYRAIEAAVLEKLKQQKPVAWRFYQSGFQHFTDEKRDWYDAVNIEEVTPLYAAPMPDDSLQLYNNLADEYGLSVFEDIAALKKRRDDLLASAARIVDHCDGQKNERDGIDALEQLREAIAAVRAGADRQCSAQDDAERWQ